MFGLIQGVAFDPVSGHLLVSVSNGGDPSGEAEAAVLEFEAATGKLLAQITESSEGAPLGTHIKHGGESDSMALTVDSHGDLYVVDSRQDAVDVYGPGAFLPSLKLTGAGGREPTTAVLGGEVNPEGFAVKECRFQYLTEEEFDENVKAHNGEQGKGFAVLTHGGEADCSPPASSILPSHQFQRVSAAVARLESGTTYRYRLVASSEGEHAGTAASEARAFTAPHKPSVQAEPATGASSTFVALSAQIDPLGAATSFYFQYGPTTSYGSDAPALTPAAPDGVSIGSGGPTGSALEDVPPQNIGGLTPGVTYHFRVVAVNAFGTEYGPDQTFTTLPEAVSGLPDNRAYELVTPADRTGGDLFASNGVFEGEFNHDTGTPSEDGAGFFLETLDAFGPFPGSGYSAYVFRRDPQKNEWVYSSLASPSLGVQSISQFIFDPWDFSRVAVNDQVGAATGSEGQRETSLLGPPGGGPDGALYTQLYQAPPLREAAGNHPGITTIVGASHDLSHVVLESDEREGAGACPGAEKVKAGNALCEWAGSFRSGEGGLSTPELKLVDARSNEAGSPPTPVSSCGATLGAGDAIPDESFGDGQAHGAVSSDGSRVLFTAPDPLALNDGPGCWDGGTTHAPQLYMRLDGATTVRLSEPEPGFTEVGAPYRVIYAGASQDGSEVFFLTETWLTANHPATHDMELYEWQAEGVGACAVSAPAYNPASKGCLTRVSGAGSPAGEVAFVPAVAAEGTAVYFAANGVLASGASPGNCEITQVGGVPTVVSGACNLYRYQAQTPSTPATTTYVATVGIGSYVFSARTNGEDCDRLALCPHVDWYTTPDGRYLLFGDGGLYRYDAGSDSVGQIAPSGEFAISATELQPAAGPVRAMSNDGSYVFFDSTAALVPTAKNDTRDVYEWHDGRISLISSGTEPKASFFLGYSSYLTPKGETVEGGNVFFGTHAQLVPSDNGPFGNIYDARICEPESPCIKPPAGETAQCEGGSCQTPPAQPLFQSPGTLTLAGSGNIASEPVKTATKKPVPKCKKVVVKRKGKRKTECVKPKKPKKSSKKKEH